MLYYFKKGKNTTERQKAICAVYGEGAVTDRMCPSGLWSCVLKVSHCTMLHSQIGQLKLIAINWDINWEQSMFSRMGANILKISQSIKLLVKMKTVSFILWKKPKGLFGQPNTWSTSLWITFSSFSPKSYWIRIN